MNWTKCSDKLPPKDGEYLVIKEFFQCRKIAICGFSKILNKMDKMYFPEEKRPGWYEWYDEYGYYEWTGITHWAELPELPEE